MALSDLTKKRRDHVESCRRNGDKSHDMIADQYSDPSHFIYELLQNADDAGASNVSFELTSRSLSITHNGEKLFDYRDVESITTIGSSTKKNDVNKIGVFGAGFKSVFAITETPCIHSGDFHFKITDFIVPEEIESKNIGQQITEIILPFKPSDISDNNTYERISNRLRALESESLLFLRNIKEIQWRTETDSGHYLSEIDGNKASLISQVNEEDSLTEYFLLTKNIEVAGTKLNIVVAYRLNIDGAVVPVQDSKLFVFFPTEVSTGFEFLVHAPYKTIPSRETIYFNDTQNQHITEELSSLVAESIIALKHSGLLNVNVLANTLPLDSEKEHPLYKSTFDKVKSIFEKESLLPTTTDHYENSDKAILAREKELTTLLGSSDCSGLFKRETWLSTDITPDKTGRLTSYLTKELGITEITMQKFCSEITEEFIRVKSDSWMVDFYSSVTKNPALYRVGTTYQNKGVLRERPIIRLEDYSHINPENNSGDIQVYLPAKGDSRFKPVKRTLVDSEESKEFLTSLGLKEPSNIAEIKEFIIPRYQGGCIELDDYAEDFEKVLKIWQQSDKYQKEKIVDLLQETKFVRCVTNNETISYQEPKQVYFPTENLSAWFDKNLAGDVYFLDSPIKLSEQAREFIARLGVQYELQMLEASPIKVCQHGWYVRSVNGFNPKFNIHGLEHSLKGSSFARSIILWKILIKNTNMLKGCLETKTTQSSSYHKDEVKTSKAMTLLNKSPWLYDRAEKLFEIPIDQITLNDLNDGYNKDHDNIEKLLKVLGLKLDKVSKFEEETGLKAVNKEDYDEFEKWKQNKTGETDWTPEVSPEYAIPIECEAKLEKRESEDLSGQTTTEEIDVGSAKDNDDSEEDTNNSIKSSDLKAVGDWGESVANKYLEKKYPSNEVVWLNKNGNTGKGYDFVIRNNGEDIAYYEVKSKIDESPKLFQVSGAQWGWARKLHDSGKGDVYKILVISNAGNKTPRITEITNPVWLWKSEKLYADPVNIKL